MRAPVYIICFLSILVLLTVPVFATTVTITGSGELMQYTPNGGTFAAMINHDGVSTTSGSYGAKLKSTSSTDQWYTVQRSFMAFDTSSIPDASTIDAAYLIFTPEYVTYTLPSEEIAVLDFLASDMTYDNFDDDSVYGDVIAYTSSIQYYTVGVSAVIPLDPDWVDKTGTSYAAMKFYSDYVEESPVWSSSKELTFQTTLEPALYIVYDTGPTPTPTPYPGNISVNLYEKYSNAILVNQAITLTPTSGGAGETRTSLYGETLHFGVVPGMEYWFNASRSGYSNYNETYTIPASPGIYNVYMERILTPIANHSYAHFSVVDQTNGGLIPNAEIRLSDGQTKLTNSAGYAWFSVNNSEQINYYVSKPSGYWPAYGAMNLTADESILVALQRYTGPTATATMPGWTPVTVPTTGTGVDPVVTLSAQLRQQNVQEGMDVWYTNLPFISQFLFLLFIIGGLGLMAGGTRRN
jgi:hypothetical protein